MGVSFLNLASTSQNVANLMIECPQCSHRFHADAHQPPTHCPQCDELLRIDRPSDWAPVARLANLADSGYFSDLLTQHEIAVQVQELDEYSALLGLWESVFVLQVARDDAERAKELINEHVETSRDSLAESDDAASMQQTSPAAQHDPWSSHDHDLGWADEHERSTAVPIWKSVAVVLIVGGLAYAVGRSSGKLETETAPTADQDTLWQALSRPGETFVTDVPPGARKFRLRFDAQADHIDIDEDVDGDGRYDRRRTFERGLLINQP